MRISGLTWVAFVNPAPTAGRHGGSLRYGVADRLDRGIHLTQKTLVQHVESRWRYQKLGISQPSQTKRMAI